jgi:hypothetical protein
VTFDDRLRAARRIVLTAARHLVIIAVMQSGPVAAVIHATRPLPLCTDPPIVATVTVVDGMPFITPRRLSFRVVAPTRVVAATRGAPKPPFDLMPNYALFDGRQLLARLWLMPDGSTEARGQISVSADGSLLRIITDRPRHCIISRLLVANSAPTWHWLRTPRFPFR